LRLIAQFSKHDHLTAKMTQVIRY